MLVKALQNGLLFLTWKCHVQISCEDLVPKDQKLFEVLKKMKAKANLIRNGSLPMSELGKMKTLMLNLKSQGSSLNKF